MENSLSGKIVGKFFRLCARKISSNLSIYYIIACFFEYNRWKYSRFHPRHQPSSQLLSHRANNNLSIRQKHEKERRSRRNCENRELCVACRCSKQFFSVFLRIFRMLISLIRVRERIRLSNGIFLCLRAVLCF